MDGPVMETRSGLVRGSVETSCEGFQYWAFKGIPYAEPPVGELRFRDPVPISKWREVRDATEYGPICAQYDILARIHSYSEDCLYLNIYVKPVTDERARKAVMVWIHGGSFHFGSGNNLFYGPDYLLKKDIVLVTINYRLGVFGFLNLEDQIAPGNQGLKDQILALRWIKDNIQQFSGDPDNITIFGESSGGIAVHYLTLSPLTQGLFHKAISQSGVALNPWASIYNPTKNARELSSILGKRLINPKSMVEFLKTVESKKLVEAQERMRKLTGSFPFGPGVDSKSYNPVIPEPIEQLASKGIHMPYLVGHNSREGIFCLLDEFRFSGDKRRDIFEVMEKKFEVMFKPHYGEVLNRYNLTPNQFRRLYYKGEAISDQNCKIFADLTSDLYVIEGIHRFVKLQVEQGSAPTYLYKFSYDSGSSLIKSKVPQTIAGTSHFDDVPYLFKMHLSDKIDLYHLQEGTQDYKIMEMMVEMWTNFAKYGRPTVVLSDLIPVYWKPVIDGSVLRYLNIDVDTTMQSTIHIEQKYLFAKDIKC